MKKTRGCDDLEENNIVMMVEIKKLKNPYQRNKSVTSNNYPTVKPVHLMAWLVVVFGKIWVPARRNSDQAQIQDFDIDHWATRYGLIQIPKVAR